MTRPHDHRRGLALGALACVLLVVVITLLYRLDVTALDRVDRSLEQGPQHFTFGHAWARTSLLAVQAVFTTLPMAVFTAVAAVGLLVRRHPREAAYVVAAMTASSLTTYLLKVALHRKRPVWEDPVTTLSSFSYPSGHATGIAAAGVVTILLAMRLAHGPLRRALVATAVVLVVLVALDRVFLGVHNPSDVLAGLAVGAAWALGVGTLLASHPAERS